MDGPVLEHVEAMANGLPTHGVAACIAERGLNASLFVEVLFVTKPGS
jgi:hypothetical protein